VLTSFYSLLNFKELRIEEKNTSLKIASKFRRTLSFPLKIESYYYYYYYYYYFIIIFDWFLIIVLLLVLGNWVIVQCVNNNTSFVVYEMQSISRQLEIWRDLLKVLKKKFIDWQLLRTGSKTQTQEI